MFQSCHEINDNGVYELSELYSFYRYSGVVEYYPADSGALLAEPVGDYRYRMVGYFTDVSVEDGSCELILAVCHEDLPRPSYDDLVAVM